MPANTGLILADVGQPVFDAQAEQQKHFALANAQQQQQMNAQALASGKLELEQRKRDQQDQEIIRKSYMDAKGDITGTQQLAMQRGASPKAMTSLQTQAMALAKSHAELDEAQLKAEALKTQATGSKIQALLDVPDEAQRAILWRQSRAEMITQGHASEADIPKEYPGEQYLLMHRNAAVTVAQSLENTFKDRERKTAEQNAQTAADNAKREADAAARKAPGEIADAAQKERTNDAAALAAAARQSPEAFAAALGELPHKRAIAFAGAKNPEEILARGLTPDQGITTAATAKRDANTAKDEAARRAMEAQRIGLDREKNGFEMNGVSPTAQMAADGRMDPATLRAMLRKQPGLMGQILKVDPKFEEANIDKRFNVLKEFSKSANTSAGGQVIALNTLIHHADLYMEVADALKNKQFVPGNAAWNKFVSMFGSAPPNNAALVARFFAGETGKVATGGVPAEGEINGILKNLSTSGSPEAMAEAGRTLLGIAGGRMIPLKEKVDDAKLGNVVQVLGPDAKAILARRGFNPDTLQRPGAGGAAAVDENPYRKKK